MHMKGNTAEVKTYREELMKEHFGKVFECPRALKSFLEDNHNRPHHEKPHHILSRSPIFYRIAAYASEWARRLAR